MSKSINITAKKTAIGSSVLDRKKQSGSPRIVPKVPGAKGLFPIKQPVAKNMTDLSLKFMVNFYSLGMFFVKA